MAAADSAKQHGRSKGRRSKAPRRGFLCFSWACCGASRRVSADRGDESLVNLSVRRRKSMVEIDAMLPEGVKQSREILVVDAEKGRSLMNDKTGDMTHWLKDSKEISKSGPVLHSTTQADNQNRQQVQEGRSTHTTTTKLSHSVSLPQLSFNKQRISGAHKGNNGNEELDSMVGAVIVTVTLIVMLVCGRVCAILCMAAWLYFFPRLRADVEESCALGMKGDDGVDFQSWEYKKKVVLEGLLERKQRL